MRSDLYTVGRSGHNKRKFRVFRKGDPFYLANSKLATTGRFTLQSQKKKLSEVSDVR